MYFDKFFEDVDKSIVFEVDYSIAMPAVTSFVIFLIKFVVDTISNQKEQTVTIFNNISFV